MRETLPKNPIPATFTKRALTRSAKRSAKRQQKPLSLQKNGDNDELMNEINDLIYHVMVLCVNQGLEWSDVERVLSERNEKIGNLKTFHTADKNS